MLQYVMEVQLRTVPLRFIPEGGKSYTWRFLKNGTHSSNSGKVHVWNMELHIHLEHTSNCPRPTICMSFPHTHAHIQLPFTSVIVWSDNKRGSVPQRAHDDHTARLCTASGQPPSLLYRWIHSSSHTAHKSMHSWQFGLYTSYTNSFDSPGFTKSIMCRVAGSMLPYSKNRVQDGARRGQCRSGSTLRASCWYMCSSRSLCIIMS